MSVSFAKQGFLNAALNWNSGSFKFVVKKRMLGGISTTFMVRDCTEQINLDFDTDFTPSFKYLKTQKDAKKHLLDARKDIKRARRKLRTFVVMVNAFSDALEQAFDELESELETNYNIFISKPPPADSTK